ncbi:MAG TPA: radical SAM protein [Candidatus Binatia bacterium]|nr:radical SAM protein [Candidatus Binatia bacterium]
MEARPIIVPEPPRCVYIEVTNTCNLLCQTCPITFMDLEARDVLSYEKFLAVVEQFPRIERAVLHGIGEPLLNKALPRMIAHLKRHKGSHVLFNSNATLLKSDWQRSLIEAQLDELRVSLDAATPETYRKIRGAPAFNKIVENLQGMVATKAALGSSLPKLSLWCTGMKENIAELPDLVRLAARLGIGEVYLQRLVFYDEGHTIGLAREDQSLYGRAEQYADDIIAECERLSQELGVRLEASGATNPRDSLAKNHADPAPWRACRRPWTVTYVTVKGNILPCCIAPFATGDYQSIILGNLFTRPFDDIWNGARYQEFRSGLQSLHAPSDACAKCGAKWSL